MNKGAEIERLRSIADNNAANGLAAEERVEELEAERDRVMRENGKLNCHIDDLEAERDRLRLLLVLLYNQGYLAGHHDTVESQYSHILSEDMYSFHADVVAEILEETA